MNENVRSWARRAQSTSKPQWACYGRANDGAEMLMGWKCGTRAEAEDIRQDVIYNRDLPASRLTVRRVHEEGRDTPAGSAALRESPPSAEGDGDRVMASQSGSTSDRKGSLRSSSGTALTKQAITADTALKGNEPR